MIDPKANKTSNPVDLSPHKTQTRFIRNRYKTIVSISLLFPILTACGPLTEQIATQTVKVAAPQSNSNNTSNTSNQVSGNQNNNNQTNSSSGTQTNNTGSGTVVSGTQTNTTNATNTGTQATNTGSGTVVTGTQTNTTNTGSGTVVTGDQTNTTNATNTTNQINNTGSGPVVTGNQTNTTNTGSGTQNNVGGNQTNIDTVIHTTTPTPAPTATPIPGAPGGLEASDKTTQSFTLKWNEVIGATQYKVFKDGVMVADNLGSTSYNVSGLASSKEYSMQVSAFNLGGESAKSAELKVTTLTPIPVPDAPTGLSSSALTETGFTLNWSTVTGATSYKIYKNGVSLFENLTTTSKNITGLTSGTAYNIQVSAMNESGESVKSTGLSVTPAVTFVGTIVYLKNNDIYMMKGSNASPVRLTNTGSEGGRAKGVPRLNSGGTRVIWSRENYGGASPGYDLYSVDTGAPNIIKNYNFGSAHAAVWSPTFTHDGSIVFNAFDASGNLFSAFGDAIYKANSSGGGVAQFSGSKGNGSAVNVRYDNILVYSDGTVRRADYNNETGNVTYGPGHAVKIAWNNTQGLFVYHNNNDIFTVTIGGIVNQVTNTASTEETPALSPNESKVIFVSNKEGNKDIFMANIDGSNMVNLTNTPGVDETLPDWSN